MGKLTSINLPPHPTKEAHGAEPLVNTVHVLTHCDAFFAKHADGLTCTAQVFQEAHEIAEELAAQHTAASKSAAKASVKYKPTRQAEVAALSARLDLIGETVTEGSLEQLMTLAGEDPNQWSETDARFAQSALVVLNDDDPTVKALANKLAEWEQAHSAVSQAVQQPNPPPVKSPQPSATRTMTSDEVPSKLGALEGLVYGKRQSPPDLEEVNGLVSEVTRLRGVWELADHGGLSATTLNATEQRFKALLAKLEEFRRATEALQAQTEQRRTAARQNLELTLAATQDPSTDLVMRAKNAGLYEDSRFKPVFENYEALQQEMDRLATQPSLNPQERGRLEELERLCRDSNGKPAYATAAERKLQGRLATLRELNQLRDKFEELFSRFAGSHLPILGDDAALLKRAESDLLPAALATSDVALVERIQFLATTERLLNSVAANWKPQDAAEASDLINQNPLYGGTRLRTVRTRYEDYVNRNSHKSRAQGPGNPKARTQMDITTQHTGTPTNPGVGPDPGADQNNPGGQAPTTRPTANERATALLEIRNTQGGWSDSEAEEVRELYTSHAADLDPDLLRRLMAGWAEYDANRRQASANPSQAQLDAEALLAKAQWTTNEIADARTLLSGPTRRDMRRRTAEKLQRRLDTYDAIAAQQRGAGNPPAQGAPQNPAPQPPAAPQGQPTQAGNPFGGLFPPAPGTQGAAPQGQPPQPMQAAIPAFAAFSPPANPPAGPAAGQAPQGTLQPAAPQGQPAQQPHIVMIPPQQGQPAQQPPAPWQMGDPPANQTPKPAGINDDGNNGKSNQRKQRNNWSKTLQIVMLSIGGFCLVLVFVGGVLYLFRHWGEITANFRAQPVVVYADGGTSIADASAATAPNPSPTPPVGGGTAAPADPRLVALYRSRGRDIDRVPMRYMLVEADEEVLRNTNCASAPGGGPAIVSTGADPASPDDDIVSYARCRHR